MEGGLLSQYIRSEDNHVGIKNLLLFFLNTSFVITTTNVLSLTLWCRSPVLCVQNRTIFAGVNGECHPLSSQVFLMNGRRISWSVPSLRTWCVLSLKESTMIFEYFVCCHDDKCSVFNFMVQQAPVLCVRSLCTKPNDLCWCQWGMPPTVITSVLNEWKEDFLVST
jgi:hypothetical protein